MKLRLFIPLSLLLAAVGCGGPGFAPVSGKVTLNGKALPKAKVVFAPIPTSGIEAGPASIGETNDQGEYTLTVQGKNVPGALVGQHRVSISALRGPAPDPNKEGGATQFELVPEQFNAKSVLKFDVPAGGSKNADFIMQGAPPGTKKDTGS